MNSREKMLFVVIGMLSGALIAGFATNFGNLYETKTISQPISETKPVAQIEQTQKIQPAILTTESQTKNPLTVIFKQVENSVVQITTKVSTVNPYVIINGMPLESQSTKLGSGFVYDKDGHIITNHHVIAEANEVDVRFVDGNIYSAKVIG